jgi:hypothetical protein
VIFAVNNLVFSRAFLLNPLDRPRFPSGPEVLLRNAPAAEAKRISFSNFARGVNVWGRNQFGIGSKSYENAWCVSPKNRRTSDLTDRTKMWFENGSLKL